MRLFFPPSPGGGGVCRLGQLANCRRFLRERARDCGQKHERMAEPVSDFINDRSLLVYSLAGGPVTRTRDSARVGLLRKRVRPS